jgi:hypothetical protein
MAAHGKTCLVNGTESVLDGALFGQILGVSAQLGMASLDFGDVPQHSCVQAHSSNSTTSTRVDLSHRLGAPSSASFFDSPKSVGFRSQPLIMHRLWLDEGAGALA